MTNNCVVKYTNTHDLKAFLEECESVLMDEKTRKSIIYPKGSVDHWDSDAMKIENAQFLSEISKSANVYAIFVVINESGYALKYIGQTNKKGARSRLVNHLFKKHDKTGAKLDKVVNEVKAGNQIAISWISIMPESLRHYVEEELITKYKEKLDWNSRGKNKRA